ncbi:MAG TPA: glycosyltransferase family 9 protein [Candidatus Binatia bacterium]
MKNDPVDRPSKGEASHDAGGARDAGRRVLLLFPGALGDAVCLEPAAAHLAAQGELVLYARGAAAEVAALYPARPRVCSLDAPEIARLFAPGEDDPELARWLAGFARVVSFTGAGVPEVARRLGALPDATLAPFPRPPLERHAADHFLGVVCGDPAATAPPPRLVAPAEGRPPASGGGARLVLLPGSGGRDKRAAPELFLEVARRWRDAGGEVTVVLGPAEAAEDAAWVAAGRVVRPGSVAELAAVLARSAAFVGNDAGPSHVAAALGVAGAVLYRSTSPASFGPRGEDVAAIDVQAHDATVSAVWDAIGRRVVGERDGKCAAPSTPSPPTPRDNRQDDE